METSAMLSLLPAPIVAIVLYLFLRFKYRNGSFSLVYKSFSLGMAGMLVVFVIDKVVYTLHLDHLHSLNRTLFYAFVLTGSVFELYKFLILRLLVYPSKRVTRTSDVIVYSLFIAAGFTTAYSIYAIFYAPPYISVSLYALTIGPVFVSMAVIMGYFVGAAMNRQFPLIDFITGLFIAIIFHGIYRFCLLYNDTLMLYMVSAGMLITCFSLLFITLKEPSASK
jgi:RsiW-degrading membrane proteinase PrsW (M82 family)